MLQAIRWKTPRKPDVIPAKGMGSFFFGYSTRLISQENSIEELHNTTKVNEGYARAMTPHKSTSPQPSCTFINGL